MTDTMASILGDAPEWFGTPNTWQQPLLAATARLLQDDVDSLAPRTGSQSSDAAASPAERAFISKLLRQSEERSWRMIADANFNGEHAWPILEFQSELGPVVMLTPAPHASREVRGRWAWQAVNVVTLPVALDTWRGLLEDRGYADRFDQRIDARRSQLPFPSLLHYPRALWPPQEARQGL